VTFYVFCFVALLHTFSRTMIVVIINKVGRDINS